MYTVGTTVFQNWVIARKIGAGSFGAVFELQREDFGITYHSALKVISVPHSDGEIQSLEREGMSEIEIQRYLYGAVTELVREYAIMAKLKANSNIVSYEDHAVVKHADGIGWDILIRMELLTPLLDYAYQHPFTRREIIQLGIDICKALELCQKYNIIHRDIKPDNIFVSNDGRFKLGDFGIARTIEKTTMSDLSKKGTYQYMAPEVYRGNEYGFSVDTYSLGIVLYRLLNQNRVPFLPAPPQPIDARCREQALMKRMSGYKIPLPYYGQGRLGEIVLKACSYDPGMRFSSPMQMRQELEAILYNCDDASLIYPDGDKINVVKNDYHSNTPSVHKKKKGNQWLAVFAVILTTVLIGGSVLAFQWITGRQKQYTQYMEQAKQCREEDPAKAMELYRLAQELRPNEEAPCISYAFTLYSVRQYEECVSYIENDLSLGKRFREEGQNQLSEILGAAYFEMGEYAAAASFFRLSTAGGAITVPAMRDYAVSLGRLGDIQAADEIMKKMRAAGASGSVMTYVQAEIDYTLGNHLLAEEGFRSALNTAEDVTVQRRSLRSLGELYRDCTALGGNSPISNPAQREIDLLETGIHKYSLQYDTTLIEMLALAYYEAYDVYGKGYEDYLAKSGVYFQKVIEMGIRKDYLYRNLYTIYYRLQDYEAASHFLQEYESAFPNDYMPHALRAILLITLENIKDSSSKDYSQALSEFQLAGSMLRSGDDHAIYDQAESLIEQLRNNGWL